MHSREIDVFIHIPKTAGSTLRTVLHRAYGASVYYFEPNNIHLGIANPYEAVYNAANASNMQLITGHYPFGVHYIVGRPCRYISIIRNPIQRSMSDYYYAMVYDKHPLAEDIRSQRLTLRDYMLSGQFFIGDEQCRMIAGIRATDNFLQYAVDNIETSFVYCGTSERLNRDILIMSNLMGWDSPLFVSRNVNSGRAATRGDEQRAAFFAENEDALNTRFRPDLSLHEYVTKKNIATELNCGPTFTNAYGIFEAILTDIREIFPAIVYETYNFNNDAAIERDAIAAAERSDQFAPIKAFLGDRRPSKAIHNYIGCLDLCTDSQVLGWASDLWSKERAMCTLRFSDGSNVSFLADRERHDIARKFNAIDRNCGFAYSYVGNQNRRAVSVCVGDCLIPLGP